MPTISRGKSSWLMAAWCSSKRNEVERRKPSGLPAIQGRVLSLSTTGNPKIAFVGTGAQGASIGADFALAGHDVTFIEQWPAHVEAIHENGITVNLPTRTINARVPALHCCQVAERKKQCDLVFLI